MKREDIGSSLFWLAVGLGVAYAGYDLELGTLRDPGSGFVLFWVGVIMAALSLAILIGALRLKPGMVALAPRWAGARWKQILSVVAALVLYAFFFDGLGFLLSTTLVLLFLFKAIEPQRWSVAIAGAVLSALAAYAVFHLWLGTQLPKGFLNLG